MASALSCGQNKMPLEVRATPSPQTTPNATPLPSVNPVATYQSGGLGLERGAWESQHGRPLDESDIFLRYENDRFAVMFSGGKAQHIERTYGDRNAVALADAQIESKTLTPADAKLVRSYTSRNERLVDLYSSQSLKDRFPAGAFISGKAGEFIVLYRNQSGRVTSFIIAIGNNP